MCKHHMGKTIKTLRSNNGAEFVSNRMKELTKNGIEHQTIVPSIIQDREVKLNVG